MKKGRTTVAAKGAKRKENLQARRPVLKESIATEDATMNPHLLEAPQHVDISQFTY